MIFLLTGVPLRLMRRKHRICSGLVVRELQQGGLLKGADPDLMLPADLAKIFGVRWDEGNGVAKDSPPREAGDDATRP